MTTSTQKVSWSVDGREFEGHAAWQGDAPKPAVLVCHAWAGQSDSERAFAEELAELGYVGMAMDVYGKGVLGSNKDENSALMMPLLEDRALLERRLRAGLDALRALPVVAGDKVAALGFCFGGLCVLDIARSGADVRGVVSFHGIFRPRPMPNQDIGAKVLVLHGYDDPMAKPDALLALCKELSDAGADWQVHAYGGTMHAFTNPEADDPAFGTVYDKDADRRARHAMRYFLEEIFSD